MGCVLQERRGSGKDGSKIVKGTCDFAGFIKGTERQAEGQGAFFMPVRGYKRKKYPGGDINASRVRQQKRRPFSNRHAERKSKHIRIVRIPFDRLRVTDWEAAPPTCLWRSFLGQVESCPRASFARQMRSLTANAAHSALCCAREMRLRPSRGRQVTCPPLEGWVARTKRATEGVALVHTTPPQSLRDSSPSRGRRESSPQSRFARQPSHAGGGLKQNRDKTIAPQSGAIVFMMCLFQAI